MPDVARAPLWVRQGHRAIVVYGAVCLLAGSVVLFCSAGLLGVLAAGIALMTPGIVLAWLAGPLAFALGHWLGDLVTKRREGHGVAKMLSRNAQPVHGTAIVLGTCGYYPLMQVEASVQPVLVLGMVLSAMSLSASAHTARHRRRLLVATSYSAATYGAIGVLLGVFSGAIWMGAFALPFAVYFAATALWLIRSGRTFSGC